MRRRPLYLSAPGDVLALEAEAELLLHERGSISTERLVQQVCREQPDLSMMILYKACFQGDNGSFLRHLQDIPASASPLRGPLRIIVVPGLNFLRHPETGADGRLVAQIGGRLGAEVKIIQTDPIGSAVSNGEFIADHLTRMRNDTAWLVSVSKGTADLRVAMGKLGRWPEWLAGWINLSGVFQGTPVADRFTQFSLRSWMMRVLIEVGGVAGNIAEMRTDSALWRVPVEPPSPNRMIHVLGFPASWSIEMRIAHHYRWLRDNFGPNDGLIPLAECFGYPGRIVPVWGADHFMRVADLARLIYRLIHFADALQYRSVESIGDQSIR